MANLIENYFNRAKDYKTFRFVFEMTIVCFILKFISVFLAAMIFTSLGIPTETSNAFEEGMIQKGWLNAFIMIIIFASFETLTGQALVIWIVSKFTKKTFINVLISAIVFSLLHVEPILIAGVFPIGLILAWTFITKKKKSLKEAFWVTTAIHVLHNLIVLILISNSI